MNNIEDLQKNLRYKMSANDKKKLEEALKSAWQWSINIYGYPVEPPLSIAFNARSCAVIIVIAGYSFDENTFLYLGERFPPGLADTIDRITKISKIATHFRPDLDSCLAVWAAKKIYGDLSLEFVPTSFDTPNEDTLYLDLECGIKDVGGLCAGPYMVSQLDDSERSAMKNVTEYVNRVDTGEHSPSDDVSLLDAIFALKEEHNDEDVIKIMCSIFDGILSIGRKKARAKELAQKTQWIKSIAITIYDDDEALIYGVEKYFDKACSAHITVIGKNIAAKRMRDDIDLTKLSLPDGWFSHASGFLVQWGDLSGKGTKAESYPTISAGELARMIHSSNE